MASNLEIFAQVAQQNSSKILRENAVLTRIARHNMDNEERKRLGDTVSFTRAFDSGVTDVVPGITAGAPAEDLLSYRISIALDKFKEATFQLNDKEWRQITKNLVIPSGVATRIKGLVKDMEFSVLSDLMYKIPNRVGTAGSAPTDPLIISDAVEAMRQNGADEEEWIMAIKSGYAKHLRKDLKVLDSNISGTFEGLRRGFIGDIYGFETVEAPLMDKAPSLSITTGTHAGTSAVNDGADIAKGAIVATVDGGTGTAVKGETFKFAGHDQHYVVQANVADLSAGSLQFFPPLKEEVLDDEVITFDVAASTSYSIHGFGSAAECQALVIRPWDDGDSSDMNSENEIAMISDPMTGITFRLCRERQHKQTRFSFDVLYGHGVVEPNNGVLIIG